MCQPYIKPNSNYKIQINFENLTYKRNVACNILFKITNHIHIYTNNLKQLK